MVFECHWLGLHRIGLQLNKANTCIKAGFDTEPEAAQSFQLVVAVLTQRKVNGFREQSGRKLRQYNTSGHSAGSIFNKLEPLKLKNIQRTHSPKTKNSRLDRLDIDRFRYRQIFNLTFKYTPAVHTRMIFLQWLLVVKQYSSINSVRKYWNSKKKNWVLENTATWRFIIIIRVWHNHFDLTTLIIAEVLFFFQVFQVTRISRTAIHWAHRINRAKRIP